MKLLNTSMMIGNLQVKNRLVMPPMATSKATEDGTVTQQLCDYYNEKSAGGYIGLIITEHFYVSAEGHLRRFLQLCQPDLAQAGIF